MNTSRFQKAIQELRAVGMKPEEKASLHASIMARIKDSQSGGAPLPADAMPGAIVSPWSMDFFMQWAGGHRAASAAVAVALLIVLGGGGAAFAAEGALPGQLLYPLKVAVIEPIHGAFFVSGDAKARYDAELVATRVQEAETLESRGELDQPKQDQIKALVAKHSADFDADVSVSGQDGQSLAEARATVEEGNELFAVHTAVTAAAMTMSAVANSSAGSASGSSSTVAAKLAKPAQPTTAVMSAKMAATATPPVIIPIPHLPDAQKVTNTVKGTASAANAVPGL